MPPFGADFSLVLNFYFSMSKLTPQNIQDLIANVQTKSEYKNDAAVKALVDEKADRLRILAEGDLDVAETLQEIDAIIKEIAAGIAVAANPQPAVLKPLKPLQEEDHELELLPQLEQSYDKMVAMLLEFEFMTAAEIPSKIGVMESIKNLAPELLETIDQFAKPTVLIIPWDFEFIIEKVDRYKAKVGQSAVDCELPSSLALWGPKGIGWRVSIVDGAAGMPQPDFVSDHMTVGQKMEKYEEEFAKKNLDVMSCQEGAMLLCLSVPQVDDILETDTVTYYNRDHLAKDSMLPHGWFDTNAGKVRFAWLDQNAGGSFLRCRPSVKIFDLI